MAFETIDLTGDAPSAKRRREADLPASATLLGSSKAVDLTLDDDAGDDVDKQSRKRTRTKRSKDIDVEKRLKRHRPTAPTTIRAVYERAINQRMFCLDRQRGEDETCPNETLKIAGSTGNVYTVVIDKVPSCDCPHAAKGNHCKHILFALIRVLKAADYWQRAYLSSELRAIFEHAPPIVLVDADKSDGHRKPIGDGDSCAICFMEFEGEEGTVYCKAACGNNLHKECFNQWAASRRRSGAKSSCPYCRSLWLTADGPQGSVSIETISQREATGEGYVNIAEELGMSTQRVHTTLSGSTDKSEKEKMLVIGIGLVEAEGIVTEHDDGTTRL